MPNPIPCPSQQDLQRLLLGQIPEPEAERLEEHLEQCDPCVRTASTLKAEDTLAEVVRTQGALPRVPPGAVVEGLMQRLERLRPATPASSPQTSMGGNKPPEGVALTAAFAESAPSSEEARRAAQTPAAAATSEEATEVIYDFLAPAQGPKELGRLGPYRVLKVLGAGGMGVVFQAEDPHLDRLVALKAMLPAQASNPSARQRFLREAKAAAAIEHDHIVTIYQVGEERGVPFLAMPLLKGEPLDKRLKREKKLPIHQVLRIGREVAEGLAAAHEHGLIHRDIKPGNIWLEGSRARVKILDFGLARAAADTAHLTQSGTIVGTPAYMAPEQTRGGPIDPRADLFSLGCMLYRLTTGELPFKGTDTMSVLTALALDHPAPPRERDPNIPPEVSGLVMQLLAKKPEDRPPSARAVVERIQAIEQAQAVASAGREAMPPVESPARPRRDPSRAGSSGRRWFAVAVVVALGMLAWGGYLLAPGIYRIATEKGEVVIETNDPNVEVVIKGGGKDVFIVDPQSKQRWQLDTEKYQLRLADQPDGLTIDLPGRPPFILRRQGEKVATVTRLPVEQAKGTPPLPPEQVGEIRRFDGHKVWGSWGIRGVAFTPNGRQVLSSDAGGHVLLWDLASGKEVRRLQGHGGEVCGVSIASDGRHAATAGVDNTARVWDLESGQQLRVFQGDFGTIEGVSLSPDGRSVITSSGDGIIRLWDVETGKLLRSLVGHSGPIRSAVFSRDGRRIVSGGRDKSVRLWDVETGKEIKRFTGHDGWVNRVDASADGRRIVSCSWDKTARVWDAGSGKEVCRFEGHQALVETVAFTPDGRYVLSGGADKVLRLWDAETGREVQRFEGDTGPIYCCAVSADGRYALSGGADLVLRLWLLPAPPPPAKPQLLYAIPWWDARQGFPANIYTTGISSDGRLFFGAGDAGPSGVIRVWEVATGKQVQELLPGGDAWFSFAQFLPGGNYLVASYTGEQNHPFKDLYLWDIATGKVVRKFVGHTKGGSQFAVSPDGKRLLSWGDDKTVRLWDVETGKELRKLEGHTDKAAGVFSPDGKQILTFSPDKTLRLWDVESGKELQLEGPTDCCTGCFSPDGKQVLSYGPEGTIRLWDLGSGKEVWCFKGQTDKVSFAGFVAGGRLVVANTADLKFRVWEAASGKLVHEIEGTRYGGDGWSLTASPDGRLALVSVDHDGSVRVLDLATGKETFRYDGCRKARAFSFSPDGTVAVAGSFRAGMFVFRLPPPMPQPRK